MKKSYGDLIAVDGVSFTINEGEIFGILGPNGAGKTTLVKMITCFFPPDSGELRVLGHDVRKEKRKIKRLLGVVPQEINLDPDFSVEKNLYVYARYFGIKEKIARERINNLLRDFQLEEKRRESIEHLSGGMKKRLLLIRALINDPYFLVMDEPTTGLDPQARHFMWEKIRESRADGRSVLLTTHYMEEAQFLCDRVAIMHEGKLIALDNPFTLIEKHIGKKVVEIDLLLEEEEKVKKVIKNYPHEVHHRKAYVYLSKDDEIPSDLRFRGMIIRDANLEDVFLKLTGRELGGS